MGYKKLLLLVGVALLLAACRHPRDGWQFRGMTPTQEDQAARLIGAAQVVTNDPHGNLARGGGIVLIPSSEMGFYCGAPGFSGCNWFSGERFGIAVLGDASTDMLHSALLHELAHIAAGTDNEKEAERIAALIREEYLKP